MIRCLKNVQVVSIGAAAVEMLMQELEREKEHKIDVRKINSSIILLHAFPF